MDEHLEKAFPGFKLLEFYEWLVTCRSLDDIMAGPEPYEIEPEVAKIPTVIAGQLFVPGAPHTGTSKREHEESREDKQKGNGSEKTTTRSPGSSPGERSSRRGEGLGTSSQSVGEGSESGRSGSDCRDGTGKPVGECPHPATAWNSQGSRRARKALKREQNTRGPTRLGPQLGTVSGERDHAHAVSDTCRVNGL
jgi:hypothetical protein